MTVFFIFMLPVNAKHKFCERNILPLQQKAVGVVSFSWMCSAKLLVWKELTGYKVPVIHWERWTDDDTKAENLMFDSHALLTVVPQPFSSTASLKDGKFYIAILRFSPQNIKKSEFVRKGGV